MNGTTENRTAHNLQGQTSKACLKAFKTQKFFHRKTTPSSPINFFFPVSVSVQPEKQNQQELYIKRFVERNWLTWLWRLVRQLWNLEGRSSGRTGWKLSSTNRSCCSHVEFLLLQGSVSSALKPFTWFNQASVLLLRPFTWFNQAYPVLDNLPYLKSTNYGLQSHLQNTFTAICWLFIWLNNYRLDCSVLKVTHKTDHQSPLPKKQKKVKMFTDVVLWLIVKNKAKWRGTRLSHILWCLILCVNLTGPWDV